jgi:hypothetical protein
MLANLFRSNQPAVLAGVLVLVPVLFGASFLRTIQLPELSMPLQAVVVALVTSQPWSQGLLAIFVVALIGVQLCFLVNDAELMERRTHLPALCFPILMAAFGPAAPLDPALMGMPFVIAALQRTWTMINTGRVMSVLFDAGMFLGVAAMFYLPHAFLVVVVWASVSVIRPFQWREYLVPFLGCAVVFYFAWAILTLAGVQEWHPLHTIAFAHVSDPAIGSVPDSQRILLFMVLGGMIPVGALSYARSYRRGIMRQKNLRSSWLAFVAALAILLVLIWLLTSKVPPVLVAVPLSVFASHALQGTQRAWVGEAAVYSLLILALWAQWGW